MKETFLRIVNNNFFLLSTTLDLLFFLLFLLLLFMEECVRDRMMSSMDAHQIIALHPIEIRLLESDDRWLRAIS